MSLPRESGRGVVKGEKISSSFFEAERHPPRESYVTKLLRFCSFDRSNDFSKNSARYLLDFDFGRFLRRKILSAILDISEDDVDSDSFLKIWSNKFMENSAWAKLQSENWTSRILWCSNFYILIFFQHFYIILLKPNEFSRWRKRKSIWYFKVEY